jgi:maltose/moltooligosaccharide transporter
MGIFNLFIVIPQVVATLALGPTMQFFLADDPIRAVAAGGACFGIAAVLTLLVVNYQAPKGGLTTVSGTGGH